MRIKECSDCGCNKSLHRKSTNGNIICLGCCEVYNDNRAEYFKSNMNAWHKFKLDNLKYLEQCYESRNL